jgi:hypothetical protein
MPRIKKKELADLVDATEARHVFHVAQPEQVWISEGRIWVEYNKFKQTRPLESSDFFMSFAKLAATGKPSEARISRWVSRFGLPILELPKRRGPITSELEEDNGQTVSFVFNVPSYDPYSMEVEEFREEAQYAHELLDVYLKIRNEDGAGLRAKVKHPKSHLGHEFSEAFMENKRTRGLFWGPNTDRGLPEGMTFREFRNLMTILAAQCALGDIVTKLVSGTHLRVGVEDSRGITASWRCDNLPTALYLQFYQLITRSKPLRRCENCGQPFELTRGNRRFCSPTCRSGGRKQHRQS